MPVYLEEDLRATGGMPDGGFLRIGVVNNMPDGAVEATKRQFLSLLSRAAGDLNVSISFYALAEFRRSGSSGASASDRGQPVENLLEDNIDGLIVTGAEPRAAQLTQETYWKSLTRVIDWAEHNTLSTVWSCLAAHATVLHLDGIRRHRLEAKRFGVFQFSCVSSHPMLTGVPQSLHVPHSRWNDLNPHELRECGYEILTSSSRGVDMFVKPGNSLFVFFQGHPEYDSDTLLLEYRRDVGRYLRSERDTYPSLPWRYFDAETAGLMTAIREKAMRERHLELLGDLPMAWAERRMWHSWLSGAITLYRNWLAYLWAQKSRQPSERNAGTAMVTGGCVSFGRCLNP